MEVITTKFGASIEIESATKLSLRPSMAFDTQYLPGRFFGKTDPVSITSIAFVSVIPRSTIRPAACSVMTKLYCAPRKLTVLTNLKVAGFVT